MGGVKRAGLGWSSCGTIQAAPFWIPQKLCRQVSCGLHMEKAILKQAVLEEAPSMADRSQMTIPHHRLPVGPSPELRRR